MNENAKPKTLSTEQRRDLRERFMEAVLPKVLEMPMDEVQEYGAPSREKAGEAFRRACVAKKLAKAAVYLCEESYREDLEGPGRRES